MMPVFASFCPAPTGRILVKVDIGDFYGNPNSGKIGQEYRALYVKT